MASQRLTCSPSNPEERPTAENLLSQHPFCLVDNDYNFYDTMLYKKIKETYKV